MRRRGSPPDALDMSGGFDTVVCGLDESPVGPQTLTQARQLLEPGGRLVIVGAVEDRVPVAAGTEAAHAREVVRSMEDALAYAVEHYDGEGMLVYGEATQCLVDVARREGATLLAVGARGRSRAGGIVLGHTAASVVRRAPCSVLIARTRRKGLDFPSSIVVGIDGSKSSLRALDVANRLGDRRGSPVRVLVSRRNGAVDSDALAGIENVEWTVEHAVDALTTASAGADLVVVGNRGRNGKAGLGSVSEHVAQRAYSSVLVVREE